MLQARGLMFYHFFGRDQLIKTPLAILANLNILTNQMAVANNLIKIIKEGQAQLHVPKTVFYNPVQEFNRDLSVLVLRTYLKNNVWHHRSEEKHVKGRGGMKVLDALSASGLRSIRYAKELGEAGSVIKKIVANDISEPAVKLIKENIELNNVQDRVEVSQSDAARLLHLSSASFDDRFHVIDLDPFGTGAQFFDAAVSSIGEAGLLMVTCTDTAVLCGNASESCFARYGSMSLRADFCHDASLRIILRSIEAHAAVYGKYIKPLLSVSADFYVRLFVQIFTQPAETKKSASKLSQIYLCKHCRTPELNLIGHCGVKEDSKQAKSKNLAVSCNFKPADVVIGDKCKICGGKYVLGGPIWSGPIHDGEFLAMLKRELELEETQNGLGTFKRIQGLIYVCDEELEVPLFFSVNQMSSILKMRVPKSKVFLSALVNAGYNVSSSHTNQNGLKTDAPSRVVWDIFCQIAQAEGVKFDKFDEELEASKQSVASRIIRQYRARQESNNVIYDFTYNQSIEKESQKLAMVRFHLNPTRDWGPKPRPSGKEEAPGGDLDGSHADIDKVNQSSRKRKRQSDSPTKITADDDDTPAK